MNPSLSDLISNRRILILGFGREGRALLDWLLLNFADQHFFVADGNSELPVLAQFSHYKQRVTFILGPKYLESLNQFDLIVKTPGISMGLLQHADRTKVTSQTELFLMLFRNQVIGITGTKGKSTTSSLIYHIMKLNNPNTVLTGNIGIPPFSVIDSIDNETNIVMELSSHQLELVNHSPRTALFLNLFEEHLDHYSSYQAYQYAKSRIAQFQLESDYFIYGADNEDLLTLVESSVFPGKPVPFSLSEVEEGFFYDGRKTVCTLSGMKGEVVADFSATRLRGLHNMGNITAAAAACFLNKVPVEVIREGILSFQPLEHRLEYVGIHKNIEFFNDSISTIPEATLAALQSLGRVHTLLLGGHDRGIDYSKLLQIKFDDVQLMLFTGNAGKRMMQLLKVSGENSPKMVYFETFEQMVLYACSNTPSHERCLLSPAASSYDQFKNFEERGTIYKQLIQNYFSKLS